MEQEKNPDRILWPDAKGMYFVSYRSDAIPSFHLMHERIALNPYDQKGKVWTLKHDDIVQKPITKIFPNVSIPSSEKKRIRKEMKAYQKALKSADTLVTREIDATSASLFIARQWYTAPPPSPAASSETERVRTKKCCKLS